MVYNNLKSAKGHKVVDVIPQGKAINGQPSYKCLVSIVTRQADTAS